MRTCSLQSGSNGNAIYVEAGGIGLLFDAGISGAQARARLAGHGRDIESVTALLISHAHSDHTRCAGVYQRRFGLPVYATPAAHELMAGAAGAPQDVQHFRPGAVLHFGPVAVHALPTPHDAPDSVAFVVQYAGRRLGILTDLGHPFAELRRTLGTLDAAYLESNYDPELLARGPYPPALKARIRGGNGHLSNEQAATLLYECGHGRLSWVALAHLSGENNTPDLALACHRGVLGRQYALAVAGRSAATRLWRV